jgi:hypothetical protein
MRVGIRVQEKAARKGCLNFWRSGAIKEMESQSYRTAFFSSVIGRALRGGRFTPSRS